MTRNIFIRKGLRFSCIECGQCCRTHGEFAYVYLAPRDIGRIAAKLGKTTDEFKLTHCATDKDDEIHLKKMVGDCVFMDENGKCKIYDVRPKQCEAWPFWIENLNPDAWNGPVKQTCRGIGTGPLYSSKKIEAIAMEREEWYDYELTDVFDEK